MSPAREHLLMSSPFLAGRRYLCTRVKMTLELEQRGHWNVMTLKKKKQIRMWNEI